MLSDKLGPRLSLVASLVRREAVLADIGTDHAYLPIALLTGGHISRAVCTDVRPAPLATARRNAMAAGVGDRAVFLLADGATSLEGLGVTDVAICGMGGELIASIVLAAPHLRDPQLRLILQPMSRVAPLRRSLSENGFSILEEHYVIDAARPYVTLLVAYTGVYEMLSELQAEFGAEFSQQLPSAQAAQLAWIASRRAALRRAAVGKRAGGEPHPAEEALLAELDTCLSCRPDLLI